MHTQAPAALPVLGHRYVSTLDKEEALECVKELGAAADFMPKLVEAALEAMMNSLKDKVRARVSASACDSVHPRMILSSAVLYATHACARHRKRGDEHVLVCVKHHPPSAHRV